MGFTRNYRNMLLNNMASPYGKTADEFNAIPNVFDDSTFFTIKDVDGNLRKYCFSYSTGINSSDTLVKTQSNNGGHLTIAHLFGSQSNFDAQYVYSAKKLVFGTNEAEETLDDYTISTIDTLQFILQPKITSYSYKDGILTNNYTCVIQNDTDVEVRELGIIYKTPYTSSYGSDQSSQYMCDVLLYRKRIPFLIELKANQPQVISFSIDVNYPNENLLGGIEEELDTIIEGGV